MNDKKAAIPETQSRKTYIQRLRERGAKHRRDAWYEQHLAALQTPRVGFEAALVAMLEGWLLYADAHAESGEIGTDAVLGGHWEAIGVGLRGLLNGETGRLDCGLVDGLVGEALHAQGCED